MFFPAAFAPGLFTLSVTIALVASYAACELTERVRAARGAARFAWIGGGGIAVGVAFWGMQYIGMLAYGLPPATLLLAPLTALSRFLAIVVSGATLTVAALSPLYRRDRIAISLVVAFGIVGAHFAGILATVIRPAHLAIDWSFTLGTFVVAMVTIATGLEAVAHVRERHGRRAFAQRLAAGLGLGLAISIVHVLGMSSLRVTYDGNGRQTVDPNQYLVAVVAIVAIVFAAAAIAAARFSRRISGERARTERLADLYTRERRSTLALQRALLPRSLPTVDGMTFSTSYMPSTVEDGVGGDWFDAFELAGGRIALSIGDAAGHGTAAAMAMNVVRQAMRNAALDHSDPTSVLGHANRAILASEQPSIVTAIFAVIDPATLTLTYASAGHPLPIVGKPNGTAEVMHGETGIPLGIFSNYEAERLTVGVPADATLVFYTDGVIEHERNVLSGIAKLERAVARVSAGHESEPAIAIDRAIFGNDQRIDDSAIMTVRMMPVLQAVDIRLPAVESSVPQARTAIRRFVASLGTSDDTAYGILLAVGEAVSNAVEHAYCERDDDADVALRARRRGRYAEITVEDRGTWRTRASEPERGRGLTLMRAFANTIAIDDLPSGTRVSMRFSIDPAYAEAR